MTRTTKKDIARARVTFALSKTFRSVAVRVLTADGKVVDAPRPNAKTYRAALAEFDRRFK